MIIIIITNIITLTIPMPIIITITTIVTLYLCIHM